MIGRCGLQGGTRLPTGFIGRQDRDGLGDAGLDPARKIIGLQLGADRVVQDQLGQGVRQRAFEPVTDLEAELALGRRDQEQNAVVPVFLAEMPVAEQGIREGFDLLALQRRYGGNDELRAGLALQILQRRRQRRPIVRLEDVGVVDDAPGQHGKRVGRDFGVAGCRRQ